MSQHDKNNKRIVTFTGNFIGIFNAGSSQLIIIMFWDNFFMAHNCFLRALSLSSEYCVACPKSRPLMRFCTATKLLPFLLHKPSIHYGYCMATSTLKQQTTSSLTEHKPSIISTAQLLRSCGNHPLVLSRSNVFYRALEMALGHIYRCRFLVGLEI